jgi:hypothetical protein
MASAEQAHENKTDANKQPTAPEITEQPEEVLPQSTLQSPRMNPRHPSQGMLLDLQRTVGNRAVTKRFSKSNETAFHDKPFAPRQVSHSLQTTAVQRDVAEDLNEMANLAEQTERSRMQTEPPPAMQINNVSDANSARSLMAEIEGLRPRMQEGGSTGTISGAEISANEHAAAVLSDYLVTVGEQGRTLSTFQQQLVQVRADVGRVSGQMFHLETEGVVDRGQTASYRAEQVVGAATGATSAQQSAGGLRGDAVANRNQVQLAHDALMDKGNKVGEAQTAASQSVHTYSSALSNLNSGITPREENPELAAKQRAIKAKVSSLQSGLSTALTVLAAIGGATGLTPAIGAAATAASTEAYGAAVTSLGQKALGNITPDSIAKVISETYYSDEVNAIEAQAKQANAVARENAINANFEDLRKNQTALFGALQALGNRMTEYMQARDTLRTALTNLGTSADQGGQGKNYSVITGLLADVDTLVVQIDMTKQLGGTEQLAGSQASEARGRVEGTLPPGSTERQGQTIYYRPYLSIQIAGPGRTGGLVNKASPNHIIFVTSESRPGSAYGGPGAANPVVIQTMQELTDMRNTVQGMRDVLSRSLGLAMQR